MGRRRTEAADSRWPRGSTPRSSGAQSRPHELNAVEREFLDAPTPRTSASSREEREGTDAYTALAGVAVLLALAVVAGVVALIQRRDARRGHRRTCAPARRRSGLDAAHRPGDAARTRGRQVGRVESTRGTLLSTLLRSPAAIGTFSSPITDRPQADAVSPDGRTLEVVENTNFVRFYDTATRRERDRRCRTPFTSPASLRPTASSSWSLRKEPDIADAPRCARRPHARPARWLAVEQRWAWEPTSFALPILVSPDDRRVTSPTRPSIARSAGRSDVCRRVERRDGEAAALATGAGQGVFDANLGPDGKIHLLADARLLTIDPKSLQATVSRAVRLPETSIAAIAALLLRTSARSCSASRAAASCSSTRGAAARPSAQGRRVFA